jgi:hypothetical protein
LCFQFGGHEDLLACPSAGGQDAGLLVGGLRLVLNYTTPSEVPLMGEFRQHRRGYERAEQRAARRWGGSAASPNSIEPDSADADREQTVGDCPIDAACVGCGHREGLKVVTSATIGVGGYPQDACATLCEVCDGQSFNYLLGFERLERAVAAHAGHRPPASS